jgi:hypothetical protein
MITTKSNDPPLEVLQSQFELIFDNLYRKEKIDACGRFRKRIKIESKASKTRQYCLIRVGKHQIGYHRIVYILAHGPIPVGMEIDHINGNPIDNRLENLRVVSKRQNAQNRHFHRTGRLFGTYFKKRTKTWHSDIRIDDKRIYLGVFKTENEAHQAYLSFIEKNI